jgi:hypothetical protein
MAALVVPLPQTNLPARLAMNEQPQLIVRLISRSAVELILVVSLVFAMGWIGVHLAEAMHKLPVRPRQDGTVELLIVKSDRRGNVSFEEGFGYQGWWHCQGNDWAVDWKFIAESGRYRVQTRVTSLEPNKEGRIEVVIGGQTIEAAVPETDGPEKWKALDLGVVHLEAKSYLLTVRPAASAGQTNMNLKSVTLRPE